MIRPKKVSITIPADVQVLCEIFKTTPEVLLEQYMRDLCSMAMNGGSDERMLAKQYFLRTYLATPNVFFYENAEVILEEFELLYQNAYPAAENNDWEQKRSDLLEELLHNWKSKIALTSQ